MFKIFYRFRKWGFEKGWSDTEKRVSETMRSLSEIFQAPDPINTVKFFGRAQTIFNVALLSIKEYFNQLDVIGFSNINGKLTSIGRTPKCPPEEEQVKAIGVDYRIGKFPFMANSTSKAIDDAEGVVKILAEKESYKILGVHIMSPNAEEFIHEVVLALHYGEMEVTQL